MSTQAQEQLGPYRVIEKIGEGGMGVVHLGLDGAGHKVAIKVLHPHVAADLKARDRLFREVDAMRRVRSRYVAEVVGAELTSGQPFVVTRFVPGRTLEETVLTQGPLEAREVIRLALGLCRALVDIHAAGVIHRDLKPSNVMLSGGEPLVIDFGIAHLVDAVRLTRTGMFVGTPGYLAPEIIRGTQITQAADVHALASTVFFAATGLPPFGTGTFEAVCYNTMEGRAQLDRAPAWLRGWLSRALEIDPVARPRAGELLRMAEALDPSGGTDRTRVMDPASAPGHSSAASAVPASTARLASSSGPVSSSGPASSPGPLASSGPVSSSGPAARAGIGPYGKTVSDLLPPVEYAASAPEEGGPRKWPRLRSAERRPSPSPSPSQPFELRRFLAGSDFVGVLILVTLVSMTVIMPVAVGLAMAALALALRAGDHFLDEHRQPLVRAALVALGHTLLALAFGMAAAVFLHWAGPLSAGHVDSLAAGAFTLGLFVLPGAGAVRRAASRILARLLPGHRATVMSAAVMGPIALISLIALVIPG